MPDELYGLSAADVATLREIARAYRGGENVPRPRHQRKKLPFRYPGGDGIEVAMFAAGAQVVQTTHTSSSPLDFYATSGFAVNKWTSSSEEHFAWWDISGSGDTDYIKVRDAGLYIGIMSFHISHDNAAPTNAQEIIVNLWALPDSGVGSPYGAYMGARGSSLYDPATYAATTIGYGMQAFSLSANDWLYFRAYNDTVGGTKQTTDIGNLRLFLVKLPYDAST